MNITSAQYYQSELDDSPSSITAVIDGMEMNVPMDEGNRHYQAVLEWVAEGNEIQAAE